MKAHRNSALIIALLFGWFTIQTAALVHEFSNEHLLTANHYCIAHSVHSDTLAVSNLLEINSVDSFAVTRLLMLSSQIEASRPVTNHFPRAPPQNT